jgi:hypothetical protein
MTDSINCREGQRTDFQFDPSVDMVSYLGHRIGKPPDHIIRCQIQPIAAPLIQIEDVDEIADAGCHSSSSNV